VSSCRLRVTGYSPAKRDFAALKLQSRKAGFRCAQVTGYGLQVTGYRLQSQSHFSGSKLAACGLWPRKAGFRCAQVTGYGLQVTGYGLQVTVAVAVTVTVTVSVTVTVAVAVCSRCRSFQACGLRLVARGLQSRKAGFRCAQVTVAVFRLEARGSWLVACGLLLTTNYSQLKACSRDFHPR